MTVYSICPLVEGKTSDGKTVMVAGQPVDCRLHEHDAIMECVKLDTHDKQYVVIPYDMTNRHQ